MGNIFTITENSINRSLLVYSRGPETIEYVPGPTHLNQLAELPPQCAVKEVII